MTTTALNFYSDMLSDLPATSWHEEQREHFGIPEECCNEAMLGLLIHRPDKSGVVHPIAFVIEPLHVANTLMALAEFLREAFHPLAGHVGNVAVIDFMPPMDEFGVAVGVSRRWVVDASNYRLMLSNICSTVQILAKGL